MRRPKTLAGGIAMAVVAVAAAAGLVVAARAVFGCGTRQEAKVIARFRADPFFAIAPPDGTRVAERSQLGSCDVAAARSSMGGPGPTWVRRTYRTPTVYGLDRLHQLFDQPAAAAGWQPVGELRYAGGPTDRPNGLVQYCKVTAGHAYVATAESASTPTMASGVVVSLLSYGYLDTRKCSQFLELPPSSPVPTCAPALHCGAVPAIEAARVA